MTGLSTLYTALSGMNAQRRTMDVIAHNIANASTPGYHRQRVELRAVGATTPGLFAGRETQRFGVQIAGTTRIADSLFEARATREDATRASLELMSSALTQLQASVPEPSDNGLSAQLDAFWSAWGDVANHPDSAGTRAQLLATADSLVSSLHQAANDIGALAANAATRMGGLATEANALADRIAGLNQSILGDPEALDLIDQRDVAVNDLARLTGGVARTAADGQVDVVIGGRAIVTGNRTAPLQSTAGGVLQWASDAQPVEAPSGEAAALRGIIGDVVPRYTAALDSVAASLVSGVNALHSAGYDAAGATGWNFFDPAGGTASSIALSADVAGAPSHIAAGAPVLPGPSAPGALDGDQARAIAALADVATGPDSAYRSMISSLAVETSGAIHRADVQSHVADSARAQADSAGGVSIDEEMANLTVAQRAFEASARVMTAIDDMLGFLLERTAV
jgi:flagellar hook-associated protein 1 FlgK